LVELILSREQRVAIYEFTHDAAYCPQVNLLTVFASDQKLRRPVPSCCHIICQTTFLLFSNLTGETKITDFEAAVSTDEQILGFDISVYYVLLVEVGEAFEELKNNGTYKWKGQTLGRFLKHL